MPSPNSKPINNHDLYQLQLLEQIEQSPLLNNRKAASILGVSLKLAHDMLAQMVQKGLVSVTKHHARRWDYFLTPAGLMAKARLSYEFLDFSMHFYRQARRDSAMLCRRLAESGKKHVAFIGSGNLAEIVYLGVTEWGLSLQRVYDFKQGNFMRLPIEPLAQVANDETDAIIVCSYDPKQPMAPRFLPEGVEPLPHMYWPVDTAPLVECLVVVEAGMALSTPSGLVLAPIGERTVLDWAIERLQSGSHSVLVSTSKHASDDAIAARCAEAGIPFYRGDLLNRAQRLRDLIREHRAVSFALLNGLCPLLDPDLLHTAIKLRSRLDCPVLYSADDAEWPDGLRLQIYDTARFEAVFDDFERPEDFAAILPWYKRHAKDELHTMTIDEAHVAKGVSLLAGSAAELVQLQIALEDESPTDCDWRELVATLARAAS